MYGTSVDMADPKTMELLGTSVEKMTVIDPANGYPTDNGGYVHHHEQQQHHHSQTSGMPPPPTMYPGAYPGSQKSEDQQQQQQQVGYGMDRQLPSKQTGYSRSSSAMP